MEELGLGGEGTSKNLVDPAQFLQESSFLSSQFESRSQNFTFATSIFCFCNSIILTDICVNQYFYTHEEEAIAS